jgi:thiol-disulfide isomerase/thioredoxin
MKFVLIPFIAIAIAALPKSQTPVSAGQIGSHLPEFSTVDLNGSKVTSAELKNKVVLIDFWATWCAPCRKEMPGYQSLFDRYQSRGFAVIGFKADIMADTEDPVRFLKELRVKYPIAIGSEVIRNKFGGLQGLPTTFIYDRHGVLRSKVIGFEYTSEIEKMIKPLL